VTDPDSLREALAIARPDIVFHLAAASSVSGSWSHAAGFFQVNTLGAVHLFEAVRETGSTATIVVASSADVYGRTDHGTQRLHEDLPMRPVSPYGSSKAAMEIVASQYFSGAGMPVIRLRLFNHTGPRRPGNFVTSSLARQIAEIEFGRGRQEVRVGNLDVVRDFTDVRDVARAYWLAATRGTPGEVYNVCSGRGFRIGNLLERLLAMTDLEIAVREDSTRMRTAEIPVLVGDPGKLRDATGWEPEIEFDRTLEDLLCWWRGKVSTE
jgi:GDP-4-dehydro-6-deoxy-D-mannose reductase